MLPAAPGRGGRLQSGGSAPFHLKSVRIGDSVSITYAFSNLIIFRLKMTERDALAARGTAALARAAGPALPRSPAPWLGPGWGRGSGSGRHPLCHRGGADAVIKGRLNRSEPFSPRWQVRRLWPGAGSGDPWGRGENLPQAPP